MMRIRAKSSAVWTETHWCGEKQPRILSVLHFVCDVDVTPGSTPGQIQLIAEGVRRGRGRGGGRGNCCFGIEF